MIDSAKAIAGLVTNPGAILDYLEVIGKGQTTVGSGSAMRRHSDHRGNRGGSHTGVYVGAGLAGAPGQSQFAQPISFAPIGDQKCKTDEQFTCFDHGIDRPRCANQADQTSS